MAKEKMEEGQSDLEEKVLFVNRCAKVVKGGRKFSFSALILVGDRKGRVGYGFAKANELSDAIRKGGESARKNLMTFEMEGATIPHGCIVKSDGVNLVLKPAIPGTGIVAGSRVRAVLELAGVGDIIVKNNGSNNPMNQVRAIFSALSSLRSRNEIMEQRASV